jgi:hypothetical protein
MSIKEVKQEYANNLINCIQETDRKNNLNWRVLQPIVINRADQVIGTEERMVINGLFDEECTEASKNKNKV